VKKKVEIRKLLCGPGAAVIFDEPTKVLAPQSCAAVFAYSRRRRLEGYANPFITTKLREVISPVPPIAYRDAEGRVGGGKRDEANWVHRGL